MIRLGSSSTTVAHSQSLNRLDLPVMGFERFAIPPLSVNREVIPSRNSRASAYSP